MATAELYKEKVEKQTEFNLLSTMEAEKLLLVLQSRGILYELGEKTGHCLAQQLRLASQLITQIGQIITDPSGINDTFRIFYSQLCKSESPKDNFEMLNFFAEQNIPNISVVSRREGGHPKTTLKIRAL